MNPRIAPLIERWKAEYLAGRVIAVEELCRDCPELIPEVSSIVELARTLDGSNRTPIDSVPQSHTRTIIHELKRFLEPPQKPDEIGRLGEYRILQLLGEGGMGAVFKAEETGLNRIVALKVLKPEIAAHAISRQRFVREAKNASSIQHDHIIPIFRVGEHNGVPYLVMPLLQGETLSDLLEKQQRLPLLQVCRIGREIALGLEAAHERGMIHRDIKPSNIWLEGDAENFKRVRILDFGLARMVDGSDQFSSTSAVVGTPAYMAPEQASGRMKVDHRADLFSLGCVIYQAATGISPFERGGTLPTLTALAMDIPQSPSDLVPTLPFAFSELVMGMLEKQPHQRSSSAHQVADRLDYIANNAPRLPKRPKTTHREIIPPQHSPTRKRSIVPYLAVFVLIVVGVMATMYFTMPRDPKVATTTTVGERPPGYAEALKLRKESKNAEALAAFRKTLERDPDDRDTWIEIACLELELNRVANAEVAFRKLLELMPNSPIGLIGLTFIGSESGHSDPQIESLPNTLDWEGNQLITFIQASSRVDGLPINRMALVAAYLRRQHDTNMNFDIPELRQFHVEGKGGEWEWSLTQLQTATKTAVRAVTEYVPITKEVDDNGKKRIVTESVAVTKQVPYTYQVQVPVTIRERMQLSEFKLERWDGKAFVPVNAKNAVRADEWVLVFHNRSSAEQMAKRFVQNGTLVLPAAASDVQLIPPQIMPAPVIEPIQVPKVQAKDKID